MDAVMNNRCPVYLMPGMRCQEKRGHAGLHVNSEEED